MFFITQTYKNGKLMIIFYWWHAGGLLYYFLDISCMFEVFYWKKEDKAEHCQLPITHLSGVNSFSDNAIYNLNNHSSPNFQLSLKFSTFSIPINVQLLGLLQRWRNCLLKLGVWWLPFSQFPRLFSPVPTLSGP